VWVRFIVEITITAVNIVFLIVTMFGWIHPIMEIAVIRLLTLVFVVCHHASLIEGIGKLLSLVYKSQAAVYLFFGNLIFFLL
jgi:hypothetical protein